MVKSNALILQFVLLLVSVICIPQTKSSTIPPHRQETPRTRPGQLPEKSYLKPPVSKYSDVSKNPDKDPQPETSGEWKGWTSLGGTFPSDPIVANSGPSNTVDLVLAIDSLGKIQGKTIKGHTVSKNWVELGNTALAPLGLRPNRGISAVLAGNQLYVYTLDSGSIGKLYEGKATISSPLTAVNLNFGTSPINVNGVFVRTPAVVSVSNERLFFGIGTDSNLYATKTVSGVWKTHVVMEPSIPSLVIISSPTAAVYKTSSGGSRIVVAVVAGNGDLYYADDVLSNFSVGPIGPNPTLKSLGIKCTGQPVAVSAGKSVYIYCRPDTATLIRLTIKSGSVPVRKELDNKSLPPSFTASNLDGEIYFTSRASDGRIMRKRD